MASLHLVFSHTWTRKLSVVLKVSYGESSSSPLRETTAEHFQKECTEKGKNLEKGFHLNHGAATQPLCPAGCSQQVDWDKNHCSKSTTTQNFVPTVLPGVARSFSSFSQDTGPPWEVKLGDSVRRIAHLTGFKPVPSPCSTESGSGEICSVLLHPVRFPASKVLSSAF